MVAKFVREDQGVELIWKKKNIKKNSVYVVLWNFLLKAPWSTEYNILLEMDFSFYKESWVISELCTFSVEKKYLESN